MIARGVIAGLESRGFEVTTIPTGRSLVQLASMTTALADWDAYTHLRYLSMLKQARPDCVLGFYDYDSTLVRACANLRIPYVASIHIYWPVCPVGTLYIDGSGICPGPGLSRCLRHMSGTIPPLRLPMNLTWLPAPLGLGVFLKNRNRVPNLRKAAAIIVPSEAISVILQKVGLSNITVVPNGLDLDAHPSELWRAGPKKILFASGAASERKGVGHFVELARRLSSSHPDAVFAATSFAGSGPVRGLGRLAHAEVLREMRESYAVVAPSLWNEPFSVTIQEAMACGKAVVAYDAGGNAEMLGGTGVIVPRGDLSALCSSVEALLRDEERAIRLGAQARARAEEMFPARKMIDGYARVLQSVA